MGRKFVGVTPETLVVAVAESGEVSSISGPWPMPRSGTLLTTVPEVSVSESQPMRRPTCVGVNCSVIRQLDGGACTPTQSWVNRVKSS